MKIIFTTFILAISLQANAGGWTSGGGELIRDAHNPWFLSNTKEVKYCIQINEKDFGQDKAFVRLQIFKAIDFWKMQLGELTFNSSQSGFSFSVGTQNFYEVECDQEHDVTYQFATLTDEQKFKLGDLSKTVAVSVRTDYDLANLKAKGFVYFQPDSHFAERPWTRNSGSRILPILVHEMGHVFGLQHSKDVQFMNEDFAEDMITPKNNSWVDVWTSYFNQHDDYRQTHLFTYHAYAYSNLGLCIISIIKPKFQKPTVMNSKQMSVFNHFFAVPEEHNCSAISVEGNTFRFKSGKDTTNLLGEAQLRQQDLSGQIFQGVPVINFWSPPEQKVYQASEYERSGKVEIARFQPNQYFKGTYQSVDKKVNRSIALEVSNSGYVTKISGVMDEEIFIDLKAGY